MILNCKTKPINCKAKIFKKENYDEIKEFIGSQNIWEDLAHKYIVKVSNKEHVEVKDGDYIVIDKNENISVHKPQQFYNLYEVYRVENKNESLINSFINNL